MIKLIKCPAEYLNEPGEKVFIAGGITNCPDWQRNFESLVQQIDQLFSPGTFNDGVLFNPRRDSFDVNDPNRTIEQIHWEHRHLQIADRVIFWFPSEALCPITLFELGKISAGTNKPIVVGTHPNYQRRADVIHQLSLIRPTVKIESTLEDVAQALMSQMRRT